MRLYVHWPFCVSRCTYCDFNSRLAKRRVMQAYGEVLLEEINVWSSLLQERDRKIRSLYMGGGTPSTLGGDEVSDLIRGIARYFRLREGAEVTVEVNPATWTYSDFVAARCGGVSRFSIGVQSLHERTLHMLGRAHGAEEARQAFRYAFQAGGAAVAVDLLYALPTGGLVSLMRTLDEVIDWRPHHISVYALTLKEKAPLAKRLYAGEIALPGEDETVDQYLALSEKLGRAGYEQYEICNFCLPGYRCQHNQAYWRREEYLGVGAGAHSLLGKCRFSNFSSVLGYMNEIRASHLAVERCQALDVGEELEEQIILGLRTSDGVSECLLQGRTARLSDLEDLKLLQRSRGRVHLTPQGMMLSNAVILELLPA